MTPQPRAAILGGALLAACGGAAPAVAPHHSAARYVIGHGESTQGAAAAEAEARRDVAAQVASALDASLTVEEHEAGGQGAADVRSRIRTETTFERAELIEVPPAETLCDGAHCRAVALLPREKAVETLAVDYQTAHEPFARACGAEADPDVAIFTRALRQAETAYPALEKRGREIEVVSQGPYAPLRADRAAMSRLRAAQEARLRALDVTVLPPETVEPALTGPVSEALVSGFAHLGLPAHPGAACTGGLSFAPRAAVTCGPGQLGPRCEMALAGVLRDCLHAATLAEIDLRGAGLVGIHPRSDADARQNVLKRLGGDGVPQALGAALRDVLPVAQ